jgi:hypothetical protein
LLLVPFLPLLLLRLGLLVVMVVEAADLAAVAGLEPEAETVSAKAAAPVDEVGPPFLDDDLLFS